LGANRELASCPFPHYRASTARDGWYEEVTYASVVVLRITLRGTVWGGVLLEALRGKAGNAKYDRSVRWQPGSRLGGAVAARVRGNHFAIFLNDVEPSTVELSFYLVQKISIAMCLNDE
jgi:hypothetical protein